MWKQELKNIMEVLQRRRKKGPGQRERERERERESKQINKDKPRLMAVQEKV